MRKIEHEPKRTFPFAAIEVTNGNHYRLRLPNGRSVFTSSTPSDHRVMRNVKTKVRRAMNVKDIQQKGAQPID